MRKTSSSRKTLCTISVSFIAVAKSRPNGFSTTTRAQPVSPRSLCAPIASMIGAYAGGGVAR